MTDHSRLRPGGSILQVLPAATQRERGHRARCGAPIPVCQEQDSRATDTFINGDCHNITSYVSRYDDEPLSADDQPICLLRCLRSYAGGSRRTPRKRREFESSRGRNMTGTKPRLRPLRISTGCRPSCQRGTARRTRLGVSAVQASDGRGHLSSRTIVGLVKSAVARMSLTRWGAVYLEALRSLGR